MSASLIRVNAPQNDCRRWWLVGHPRVPLKDWTLTSGERRTLARQQRSRDGAGWAQKTFVDLGNQSLDLDVSTTLALGSMEAAFRLRCQFSHPDPAQQPHPWSGDVVQRLLLPGGIWLEEVLRGAVISLAPFTPLGTSLTLNYRIQAGASEVLGQGRTETIRVLSNEKEKPEIFIYGRADNGDFATGTDFGWEAMEALPQVGWVIAVTSQQDLSAGVPATTLFEVVAPGGSAAAGRIAVEYPVHANLSVLQAALDGGLLSADLVTSAGRPAVRVRWVGSMTPGLEEECSVGVTVYRVYTSAMIYNGRDVGQDAPTALRVMGDTLTVDVPV